jgi:hypothetical protein
MRFVPVVVVLAVAVGSLSAGDTPRATDLNANAALKYWEGFACAPKLTDAEQKKLRDEPLKLPLDATARKWIEESGNALREMHHGAKIPQCAWAVSYEDGITAMISHCQAARYLAGLANLRARARFEEGKSAEAVDDVLAAMTMGRHLSGDGTLIGVLVACAIEQMGTVTLAAYLPKLDKEALRDLSARIEKLPPAATMADGILMAEQGVVDYIEQQVRGMSKEQLVAYSTTLENNDKEKGRAFVEGCGGSAEGVIKFAEETRPYYKEMARIVMLPLEQCEKEWQQLVDRVNPQNPFFKLMAPQIFKLRQSAARLEVRQALRSAAIAILLDGRDAGLKTHVDPVDHQPFDYVAFEGGFELRSRFKVADQPLSLTVGQRKSS